MNEKLVEDGVGEYGYKQELKRALGFWGVVVYGLIFICPMAAMQQYGYIAQASGGMEALVFIIGLLGMIFTGLSYGKMVKEYAVAGSAFSYIQRSVNPHVGFIAGWLILVDYALLPAFLLALGGVWVNMLIPAIPVWLAILVIVAINTAINIVGIEWGSRTNFILLAVEVVVILLFLIAGVVFVGNGGGAGKFTIAPFYQPGKISFDFIAAALSIAVVTFLGFDAMTTLAEETDNPKRTLPRAMLVPLFIAGFFFVATAYVGNMVHPGFEGLNPDTGFYDAIIVPSSGNWLKMIILIVNILSVAFGVALNSQLAASRILYGMARDKLIPSVFGKVHPRFKTPWAATFVFGILTLAIGSTLNIEVLIKLVNFGAMTTFLMLNFAVIWFFFVKQKRRGFGNFINYFIFPAIGFLIIAYVWYGFDVVTKIVGCSWVALGIIYLAIKSKGFRVVPEALMKMDV